MCGTGSGAEAASPQPLSLRAGQRQEGATRPRLLPPRRCLPSPCPSWVLLSPLALGVAAGVPGGAGRRGGQSTAGAAPVLPSPLPRSYPVAFDGVPVPTAPLEHRRSLDVVPTPAGDAARCRPRSGVTGPRCKSQLLSCSSQMPCLLRVPAAAFCSALLLPGRSQASPLPAPPESLVPRGERVMP